MESNPAAAPSAEEIAMFIEQLFRNTDADHPLITELKRICQRRRQSSKPGGAT
jgi:hypothetical protein